jgi:hypothetical protein
MYNSTNRVIVAGVLFLTAFSLTGCGGVQRELTINTQPAGALVTLNDEEIGVSPVTVSFNWYGDYSIRISKPGFETLNTHRELKAPWYDGFPFDFIASFCWPAKTLDSYEWTVELKPYKEPARDDLLQAAQNLKNEAFAEFEKPPKSKK